jgi:hypothetical protein
MNIWSSLEAALHEVFQSECQITTTKVRWEEHTTLQTNKETNLKDKHRNDYYT